MSTLLDRAKGQAQSAKASVAPAGRRTLAFADADSKVDQALTKPPADAIPLLWQAAAAFKNVEVPVGPTPGPGPGPSEEEADRRTIDNVLAAYVEAYKGLDPLAIARIDPSTPIAVARRQLNGVTRYSLALENMKYSIGKDDATVTCVKRIEAVLLGGQADRRTIPTTFTLRRSGGGTWSIIRVAAQSTSGG
jgi:hypothetical protein